MKQGIQMEENKEKIYFDNEEDSKIIKDIIIGFLITKHKRRDGSYYISNQPLIGSWDDLGDDEAVVNSDDEIIGIIPAPPYSHRVLGLFKCVEKDLPYPHNGVYDTLGYEFPGAYYPNWKKLLEERIQWSIEIKEKEERLKKGDLSDLKKVI